MMVTRERARYGAAAHAGLKGKLPNPFPRIMGPNALRYLQEVVDSGLTIDMTGRFERAFAQELGVKHCIAAPGCTPSLAMLAAALPFEPGDEIVVSPVTDYGTLQGMIHENYIPVFADTEPGTVNLSARTIEAVLTDRTRALLIVHKTGIIADMDPILALAERHNLLVIEDCCQAVFGEYKGRLAGTLGAVASFSFDAEKTMGSDTGGCIVTNDDTLAERMRFYGQSRAGVMEPHFGRKHIAAGYAFRMPQCTAAVTLAQLEIARENVAHRDKMIRLLTELLAEIPGVTPLSIPDYLDVYSCWMVGFNIDLAQFRCNTEEFAQQCAADGIPGAGIANYYLMPEALTFLNENAQARRYPYSMPPASRTYVYDETTCPTAHEFLKTFVRWSTFCEKYTPEHCELAAEIVRGVAARNRI
jgi:dTDP-4-amino-4,6-dideoxygalactose transaminase